jgi:lipoprotein signal peptidase
MRWRSPPKTDDEFVETVRKTVTRFDRWSAWSILFFAVLTLAPAAATLIMLAHLEGMLQQFANQGIQPNARHVWWFLSLGAAFGLGLGHSVHLVLTQVALIISGMRTERLLLRYYDACQDSLEDDPSSLDDDGVRDV